MNVDRCSKGRYFSCRQQELGFEADNFSFALTEFSWPGTEMPMLCKPSPIQKGVSAYKQCNINVYLAFATSCTMPENFWGEWYLGGQNPRRLVCSVYNNTAQLHGTIALHCFTSWHGSSSYCLCLSHTQAYIDKPTKWSMLQLPRGDHLCLASFWVTSEFTLFQTCIFQVYIDHYTWCCYASVKNTCILYNETNTPLRLYATSRPEKMI